jgi:hypothetical protein
VIRFLLLRKHFIFEIIVLGKGQFKTGCPVKMTIRVEKRELELANKLLEV